MDLSLVDFLSSLELGLKKDFSLSAALISSGRFLSEQQLLKAKLCKANTEFLPLGANKPERIGAQDTALANYLLNTDKKDELISLYGKVYGLNSKEILQLTGELWENKAPWNWQNPSLPKADDLDPYLLDFLGRSHALAQGAALVGVAPLTECFLYSSTTRLSTSHKLSIDIVNQEEFQETKDSLLIPQKANKVLLIAYLLNPLWITLNEQLLEFQAKVPTMSYYQQVAGVLATSKFINNQGYIAIPSAGGLMVLPPMGVLAGLGETGRHGLLITPEYGPNIQLFSIITDWPFQLDEAINFGAVGYCQECKKCLEACPVEALPAEETLCSPNEKGSQSGVLKWYVKQETCLNHWLKSAQPCQLCLEVCPYVKEPMWSAAGHFTLKQRQKLANIMLSLPQSFTHLD